MSRINSLKGFYDVLPTESPKWQAIERIARETAERYNFGEIRTPVLESTKLFHRGVGEGSDIVRKETYTFDDRDRTSVTLRPEGTAGVARAVIEAGLLNDQGSRVKVYYLTSNFRHENVQDGRVRQHHQFGVEAFGVADADQDVECIQLQMDFYRRCGVRDLQLQINSLGDAESKARYREALVAFLSPKASELSEDSRRRLGENPLRILDSKLEQDVEAREGAPAAADSLSEKSRAHFERARKLLDASGLPYVVNPNLVRGFDYYTETLWEVTASGLGAQNAIGGGGRYDTLVEQLGGRPTPGVGFGSGLERLLIALDRQAVALPIEPKPLVWLVAVGDAARDFNFKLAADLRAAGVHADFDPTGRSAKNQFKLAERAKAKYAVVVGDDELAAGTVVLKDLAARTQSAVPNEQLVPRLAAELGAANASSH